MPSVHATLSPSSAYRWVQCSPSAKLNQKYTEMFGEKTSTFAEEGTKAHSLAELKLRKEIGEINDFNFNARVKELGEISPDMDRATDEYVDIVLTEYYTIKKSDPSAILCVEQRLDMSDWIPFCFGTSDSVIVSDVGLIVIDYKNGSGTPVSAIGNYQMRIYALGAYHEFHDLYAFKQVKYIIVQPHLNSVTSEVLEITDLLVWADTVIRPAAQLAWKGEGEFKAGDHCQFCNVKAICRERVTKSLSVIQNLFDSPDVLSDKMLNDLLPFLDAAEDWIKSVREYAYGQALSGKIWRGYKLVRGKRPPRGWKDESSVIEQLEKAGYTSDQYETKPKLKSPAELEKVLKKSAFEALLSDCVTQGDGKLSLVPEDDPREAYSSFDMDFGDLTN